MKRRMRGYTLVELMMVVAISGILFAIGPPLLVQVQNFYLMTNARQEIERDARVSLDTINRTLRQGEASTIVLGSSISAVTTVVAPTDVITPSGQCAGTGGTFSAVGFTTIDGRNMFFFQSGNYLCSVIGPKGGPYIQSIISRNLQYIAFTAPATTNPTIVSVAITMSKAIQLGQKKVLELTIQKVRVMN